MRDVGDSSCLHGRVLMCSGISKQSLKDNVTSVGTHKLPIRNNNNNKNLYSAICIADVAVEWN